MSDCRSTIVAATLPSSPTGLVANGGVTGVILAWEANAVAEAVSSYRVYRSTNRGGPFTFISSTANTTYTDTSATSNTVYWYRITAVNIGGEGSYTDVEGSFTSDVTAPGNPSITTTTVVGTTAVKNTWTSPTDNDLAGFNVYARIFPAAYVKLNSVTVSVLEYTHTAATAGSTWDYKITSLDLTGNESTGATVSIAVPGTDVTAPAIPSTPVGVNESTGIRLTWTPNTEPDLASYKIYRSHDAYAASIGTVLSTVGSTYLDTTATTGITYSYKVTALDAVPNESSKSGTSNAVLRAAPTAQTLSGFIKQGAMVPCVVHARGVGLYTYESDDGDVTATETEDFTALASGSVLTAKYDWDFAAGVNEVKDKYTQLRGFNGAHAYNTAGTYTVRLTRTDEAGKVDTFESKVVLAADTRTKYYVSSDGTGTGTSSSSPMNLSKAIALLSTTATVKLVLRCGDTFWLSGGGVRFKKANQMVTSESTFNKGGVTTKPVIGYNVAGSGRNLFYVETTATNAVIENVTLDASYTGGELKKDYGIRLSGSTNTLVRGIDVTKFGSLVESSDVKDLRYVLVEDCRTLGNKALKNGIMYIKADDVVILGCKMSNSRNEHCIRYAPSCRTLVAYCDLRNMEYNATLSPWKDLDVVDDAKTVLDIQQGYHHYACHNKLTISLAVATQTGTIQIGPLNETTGHVEEYVKYVVLERNEIIQASMDIQRGSSYVMIRNNIITKDGGQPFQLDKHTRNPSDKDADNVNYSGRSLHHLYIYNNTVRITNKSGQLLRNPNGLTEAYIKNNIFQGSSLEVNGSASTQTACAYLKSTDTSTVHNQRNTYATFNKFIIGSSYTAESVTNWNKRTNFSNNVLENAVLNTLYKVPVASQAKTLARPVLGVFEDYYGTSRLQTASSWVAGAVEGSY